MGIVRFVAVAFALLLSAGSAWADTERRVALIIGNDSYKSLKRLDNGVNDARAMAAELKAAGFETVLKTNAGRKEMHAAVTEFGGKLASGSVGLFYYAGHGIQSADKNFLIPVDADLQNEDDLDADAIDAGKVMRAMEAARNRLNIVILDACRDNPLPKGSRSGSRGLAVIPAPTGTFVAYATGPGKVAQDGDRGSNGVYTGELIKALREPGLRIEEVFKKAGNAVMNKTGGKQVPWTQASLQGDFYFRPAGAAPVARAEPAPVAPAPAVSTVDPVAVEMTYWQSAEKAGTLSAYQAYAKKFPHGQFIDLAQAKIADLRKQQQASVAPAAPVAKPAPAPVVRSENDEVKFLVQDASRRARAVQPKAIEAQRMGVANGGNPANGYGVFVGTGGDRYEGEKRDGKRNGYGVNVWPEGHRFEGEWRDDKINGLGAFFFSSGSRWEGEWKDGKRSGYGIFFYKDGRIYEGEARNDDWNGRGVMTYADGRVEAGIWRDDKLVQPFAVAGR
jgi:uncharacterized caspase-like protein